MPTYQYACTEPVVRQSVRVRAVVHRPGRRPSARSARRGAQGVRLGRRRVQGLGFLPHRQPRRNAVDRGEVRVEVRVDGRDRVQEPTRSPTRSPSRSPRARAEVGLGVESTARPAGRPARRPPPRDLVIHSAGPAVHSAAGPRAHGRTCGPSVAGMGLTPNRLAQRAARTSARIGRWPRRIAALVCLLLAAGSALSPAARQRPARGRRQPGRGCAPARSRCRSRSAARRADTRPAGVRGSVCCSPRGLVADRLRVVAVRRRRRRAVRRRAAVVVVAVDRARAELIVGGRRRSR